jgi:hypothetical protein
MHLLLILTWLSTLLTLTTSSPTKSLRSAVVFSADSAYQISNLTIFNPPANSTLKRTITFAVEDPNPGMSLKTTCSKSAEANGQLESDFFTNCENNFFHFSLRDDGTIWLYRFIRDARYVFPTV